MTEKIIVIPQEVRGLGNIVDEKELADYDRHNSALTESTATVFGKSMTVYTMEATGYHLSLTLGGPSVVYGEGVYCFATLTDIEGDAVSDASIKFYVDDTLRDTQSTNSSGKAITTTGTNLAIGSHSIKAVYTTADGDVTATATLTVTKKPTTLTINTPTLVYSDEFDVTGTLKDSTDNEGIGNATVTLHWKVGDGPEQTATARTGQYGAVTFHRSAPTSVTDYTFWMTYDGTAIRNGASTSEVTVNVDKETSVLNVTSPTQNQQVTPNGTFDITGEITDNDGQYIPSVVLDYYCKQGILIKDSGTISVDANGMFSKTIYNRFDSMLSTGTVQVIFSGNDNYTSVQQNIDVQLNKYNTIVVTADKSILSYADGEKATLYAQLKKNSGNVGLSGVSITFKQGNTVLGTASTNSSGLAVLTNGYTATGVGDVGITATDGTFVSEIFVLQDCEWYDSLTENHNKWTLSATLSTNNHNANGWKYGDASGLAWIDNNFVLTDGISIEYTPYEIYGGQYDAPPIMVYFENQSQTRVYYAQGSGYVQMNSSTKSSHSASLGNEYRIEYTGTTLKVYLGDTLVGSASHSLGTSNIKLRLATGASRNCRIKDFKIKPL